MPFIVVVVVEAPVEVWFVCPGIAKEGAVGFKLDPSKIPFDVVVIFSERLGLRTQ